MLLIDLVFNLNLDLNKYNFCSFANFRESDKGFLIKRVTIFFQLWGKVGTPDAQFFIEPSININTTFKFYTVPVNLVLGM